MRYFPILALAVTITACAPAQFHKTKHPVSKDTASHYGHTSGRYHNKNVSHTTNPHAPAPHSPVPHSPAPHSYMGQSERLYPASNDSHYSNPLSYAQSEPVNVYPVGCRQIDVSNCEYRAHVSPSHHKAPALRGRAKKNVYASLGAGTVDLDRNLYAGVIRMGVDGGYLGLEVEGSKGFKSDTTMPLANTEQNLGLDYSVAGFGVVRVPLGKRFRALGRFGYHFSQLDQTLTVAGVSTSTNQKYNDLAYGGGLEFDVTPKDVLRLDYTGYETDFIGRKDSITASYQRRF